MALRSPRRRLAATTCEYVVFLGIIALAVVAAGAALGVVSAQGFGVAEQALSVPSAATANDIGR